MQPLEADAPALGRERLQRLPKRAVSSGRWLRSPTENRSAAITRHTRCSLISWASARCATAVRLAAGVTIFSRACALRAADVAWQLRRA
jgi:hypothetical protein